MRLALPLLASLLALSACRNDPDKIDTADPGDDCTWYADVDGDGYGDPGTPATGPCAGVSEGYVDNDDDCDDTDAGVNPAADEL